MRILAVDPGGTTGFSQWHNEQWVAWSLPIADARDHIWDELGTSDDTTPPDLVVFESFHIGPATLKKGGTGPMDTIEFIGLARYLAERRYGVKFETQSPAEAKTFSTDAKLKKYGWWTKGSDHSRDASRHLMLALAKRRIIDLRDLIA